MKAILSSKREIWILFAGFALICVAFFFLGQWSASQTNNANLKAIYDQGVTVGEATGMNTMQGQCDAEVQALARNCKTWYNPTMSFGNVNLTEEE